MDAKISELIEKMSELGFSTGCSKDDVFKKLKKNDIKGLCIEMESVICHLGARVEKATEYFNHVKALDPDGTKIRNAAKALLNGEVI